MEKVYQFEKQGLNFYFRKPEWNDLYNVMYMEWKVEPVAVNSKNDGYFYRSTFKPDKKAMTVNFRLNGKKVDGVVLPDEIFQELQQIHDQLKTENHHKKLTSDIKYQLNDMTAYGIYNGISESDIRAIVSEIKKKYDPEPMIWADDIASELKYDEELKKIAYDTYKPYPMKDWWKDEIKQKYPKWVEEKTAEGYGTIPNKIIWQKIEEIVARKAEEEKAERQAEAEREKEAFLKAKQTGEKQIIRQWLEPCNDPQEQCNIDSCTEWAMPDGTKRYTRIHTW